MQDPKGTANQEVVSDISEQPLFLGGGELCIEQLGTESPCKVLFSLCLDFYANNRVDIN
jgi:hypothetical protein